MTRAAVLFFCVGLFLLLLGVCGIAGLSPEIGKIFLVGFFALGGLSGLAALVGSRRPPSPPRS